MTIAVTGATGQLGRIVIGKLKEKPAPTQIVALVRDPARSNQREIPIMMNCDPVTGACLLPALNEPNARFARPTRDGMAVRYIGDPMCSWCWGISPIVSEVATFCAAEGIEFSVTVGGLRAGGGDPWNEKFKTFLRMEWRHIAEVTGQPFGFALLDLPQFDYDTEPACRAVVALQLLQASTQSDAAIVLRFFSAVQRKFYVEGKDPKVGGFYKSICADLGVNFDTFCRLFDSVEARQAAEQEFLRCRQWGVRSFPTMLFERDGEMTPLAVGAVQKEQVIVRLKQLIAA